METNIKVRNAKLSDAPRILEIYTYYVENTVITFEYDVPSLEEFENRMIDIMKKYPYLVIERDGKLVALVYPDAEAMKQNKVSREALVKIINDTRKQVNQQIPAYSQIAHIQIHDEEFEKTPKRSIKRYLYQ